MKLTAAEREKEEAEWSSLGNFTRFEHDVADDNAEHEWTELRDFTTFSTSIEQVSF